MRSRQLMYKLLGTLLRLFELEQNDIMTRQNVVEHCRLDTA